MLIVLVHNDGTGTDKSANYTYEVRVNDKVLERGNIKGFDRSEGWQALLGAIGERNLTPRALDAKPQSRVKAKSRKASRQ